MTSDLFTDWIKRFSAYIRRTPDRKVISLIENCSAHGYCATLPELCNVGTEFLPRNTTYKLQPLDAGIIASLKLRYRRLQMETALDVVDENAEST